MIHRAKENIRNSKKKFPHEENKFSITHYKYPPICQFTKTFLEYSAEDIFYTAIACIEVLSKGKLVNVKLRTLTKFNYYKLYKKKYDNISDIRQAYYVRKSYSTATQAEFSKDSKTSYILSMYRKINAFVLILNNHPDLIKELIKN